ncbi:MAG: anthranilate phosphoribosyltransferase [Nitriliruptorales bacterium]|nr:anthranilate phosphoribosyltransferase [Nitriliruptorales bacterium]
MSTVDWPDVLTRLVRGQDLDDGITAAVMTAVMSGDATAVQIAGFLMSLRAKGETAGEIAGLVRGMREFALPLDAPAHVVDTCGTGGDRAGTFNVSTVSAVVAAAAGATVAKHGNRAASGRCGSADLLEAWGVVIDLPPAGVSRCIDEIGIGFCFAPTFHPAMRYAGPARRELGVPTVFNFLGPLTNPAGARHQTIGVSDPGMAPKMAQVLAQLGTAHAFVFHGEDGLDELTTTSGSTLWEVRDGDVERRRFDPADLGIPRATLDQLKGGGVEDNVRIANAVLDGQPGAPRDIVVLGAAAALVAADRVGDWDAGLAASREAIDSGRGRDLVGRWVAMSQTMAR